MKQSQKKSLNDQLIYDKYLESTYSRSNSLKKSEYENACKEYERLYAKFLSNDKKKEILDIGCGAGHFLYYLKKMGFENFLGIDISAQQIEFCKSVVTKKVKQVDVFEFLDGVENKYNLILASDLLEHIKRKKIIKFLGLVYQSLKKDGILFLRVPNMSNPFSIDSRYRDFTHLSGFTDKSLFQILYSTGFRDIQISSSEVRVKSINSFFRKLIVLLFHKIIKFFYYIQEYSVPNNLGKNLFVTCKK